jgi:phospholipase C
MTIISPWTRGGRVSSELADHTSVIQFLEQWSTAIGKPAICANISPWRREVCSDLVGIFNFASPVTGLPSTLPSTSSDTSFALCAIMVNPSPTTNALPSQEAGTRPALALPYQANAAVTGFAPSATSNIAVSLELANVGHWATSGTHFWVYANSGNPHGPWPYTVAADSSQTVTVDIGTGLGAGAYNLTLIGPNRFRRDFKGNSTMAGASVSAALTYHETVSANTTDLVLTLTNGLSAAATFTITPNHYTSATLTESVAAGSGWSSDITATFAASGWYDFTITVSADSSWSQRFTGHLENGLTSITG